MRRVASSNEFFDILDKIKGGQWVTIGYVCSANLDSSLPKVKRKNPLTNRLKGYPDHEFFGSPEEIGALVKITSYNMHWSNRESIGKKYGEWKNSVNNIRGNFGIDPISTRPSYKGKEEYGSGIDTYNGNNQELQGNSYNPQNIYGVKPKSIYYCINQDGHIMHKLTSEQLRPYMRKYKERDPNATSYYDSGANALAKIGAEDEKIKDYLSQIANLKFQYINFEADSILWIAATVNGEKIVYINDNLNRAVDGINIRPEDFRAIARERYQIDLASLHEMTMKRLKVLAEMDWRTYDSAREKAEKLANETPSRYEKERRNNQADAFRKHANSTCDKQYGIDKIKQKERNHDTEVVLGTTKQPFKHTNGELKRLERQSRDVQDYYDGKQEYKNGKWINKESKNTRMGRNIYRLTESELKALISESVKRCIKEWKFSPDQLDDKAYMDDFYAQREKMMNDDWERRNIAIRKKYPGKSREWYEAMLDTFYENKENKKKHLTEETFQNNQGYSHFAVNKATNKIVNGWDYSDYDSDELRQFKSDYFIRDLLDYDLDPKQYKIVTGKFLLRQGIDPNDNNNWANS